MVELGSWQGKSSTWIASGLRGKTDACLYCVDTWEGSVEHQAFLEKSRTDLMQVFNYNIERNNLSEYVKVIRMKTGDAAAEWKMRTDTKIDLLFIDADHSYDGVHRDFEDWECFVPVGNLIVFDDVPSWPGPTRLCAELVSAGKVTVVGRMRNTLFTVKNTH